MLILAAWPFARYDAEKAFEQVHQQGAMMFGIDWLRANEAAVESASKLGVPYDTDPAIKLVIVTTVFAVMQKMADQKQAEL